MRTFLTNNTLLLGYAVMVAVSMKSGHSKRGHPTPSAATSLPTREHRDYWPAWPPWQTQNFHRGYETAAVVHLSAPQTAASANNKNVTPACGNRHDQTS